MLIIAATRKVLALAESLIKGDRFSGCLAYSSARCGYWRLTVVIAVEEMNDDSLACEVKR